jgi:hypothetical protein
LDILPGRVERDVGKKSKERYVEGCNPSLCGMEDKVENTIGRFFTIADKLAENQVEMRLTIQQLTENFKLIEKMDGKISEVEKKVDENSKMVWKMVGGVTLLSVAIPVILSKIL